MSKLNSHRADELKRECFTTCLEALAMIDDAERHNVIRALCSFYEVRFK